ncbi:37457_t:CDS:1, partial [Gigaspora margarita]
ELLLLPHICFLIFATFVLQNPEEKTDIVTFKLEDVEYNRLGKNLTKVIE